MQRQHVRSPTPPVMNSMVLPSLFFMTGRMVLANTKWLPAKLAITRLNSSYDCSVSRPADEELKMKAAGLHKRAEGSDSGADGHDACCLQV